MELATLLGWIAAVLGSVVGIPQAIRIIRTRAVEGISLLAWQSLLVTNIAWGTHGALIGEVNMLVVNVLAFFCTITVLFLMARARGKSLVAVFAPGVLLGLAMVAIDVWAGSAVFGTIAAIPGVGGLLGQSVALIRARSVKGVSMPFLGLTFANFVSWAAWGYLVDDAGTLITNVLTAAVSGFNLLWLVVRRLRRS
ncbi:SemiSWEET family sugar transporter [Aestuariimicrobium ganziense]|uniref:SemiSWEET family sugar transporter n=1 Tax=Aestuariimicrobium ganziense TaxID=2773677 RepID=UPI0019423356|nr:SemiSWEET family transporter [Aestuariimicrobium ganziense]